MLKRIKRFHLDERGEVTTQQMMYLAIGAIVAALLYKFGGRLLRYVSDFIDGLGEGDDIMNQ